ncbi:hypothetical protein [Sorangium sp. So ce381]
MRRARRKATTLHVTPSNIECIAAAVAILARTFIMARLRRGDL